ncbi:AraC family transcriptional regulator [Brevibacillus laterosporus]|uniref:helix-turn-helix domain-containing protein n=1 Tax=Brevibacillus laterosporus TaxID=1465 RepID=UPI003D25948B
MDSSIQIVKKSQVFLWEDGASSITFTAETPTLLTTLGQIQIVIGTTLYQLSKGNVMFLRPNDAITVEYNEDTAPLVYQVGFEYYELVEYTEENIRYGKNHDHLPPSGWMTEFLPYQAYVLIQKIVEQYQPVQSAQNSQCRFLLDELLHIVFSQKRDIRKHQGIPSIEKALFYIQEHYHTPITRSQIAQMIGFNESYFSTLFRKQIGWGFSEHVNRIRIDKTKEYLLTTNLTLHEIAGKVGYTNGLYVSRKFKQMTGISPDEFRKRPRPKRIAAFQFVGHLLAIGIIPVATDSLLLEHSQLLQNELDGISVVNHNQDLEQLKQLEIDVIIAPSYFYNIPGRIKKLEKIAPVLTIEWGKMSCLEETRFFGKLLGKEEEAQRWINHYLNKVNQAKRRITGYMKPGETVALYEIREDGIFIWDRTARGVFNLYDMLGMTPPVRVQQEVLNPSNHLYISEASLPEYAADHMFVVVCEGNSKRFLSLLGIIYFWNQEKTDNSREMVHFGTR